MKFLQINYKEIELILKALNELTLDELKSYAAINAAILAELYSILSGHSEGGGDVGILITETPGTPQANSMLQSSIEIASKVEEIRERIFNSQIESN